MAIYTGRGYTGMSQSIIQDSYKQLPIEAMMPGMAALSPRDRPCIYVLPSGSDGLCLLLFVFSLTSSSGHLLHTASSETQLAFASSCDIPHCSSSLLLWLILGYSGRSPFPMIPLGWVSVPPKQNFLLIPSLLLLLFIYLPAYQESKSDPHCPFPSTTYIPL